ncbi:hypothetical protein Bca101_045734 [Brassica carinata]
MGLQNSGLVTQILTERLAPRKKGRIYGVGSLKKSLASAPACSSSTSSDQEHLKTIIEEQACLIRSQKTQLLSQDARLNKFDSLFGFLATKDSALATMLQTCTEPTRSSPGEDPDDVSDDF